MTNEITIGEVANLMQGHVQPALVCGGWMTGLLGWLVLLVAALLIGAIFCLRKSLILDPIGILNPAAILRVCGVALAVTGIVLLWDLYNSVVYGLFILASDAPMESKQSFLLGIFQWPQRFIVVVIAQVALWVVLSGVVRMVRSKTK